MINKMTAYDRAQTCNSRFRHMIQSDNPTDRANAEVYRLGSQEWQSVAISLGPQFNAHSHLESIRIRWSKYVNTGVTHDSLETLAKDQLRKFVEDDRRMRMRGVENPPEEPKPKKVKPDEIAPDDPRNFVEPLAIEGVLNDFREAFGMPVVEFTMGKVQ